jgi:hypothetical protein
MPSTNGWKGIFRQFRLSDMPMMWFVTAVLNFKLKRYVLQLKYGLWNVGWSYILKRQKLSIVRRIAGE